MNKWLMPKTELLVQEIRDLQVNDESVAIWYLGQEAFLIKQRNFSIMVDPYLTDFVDRASKVKKGFWVRNYPAPVEPEQMRFVDMVLCTHSHSDHMDPDTIRKIAEGSKTKFVAPIPCLSKLTSNGVAPERCIGACAGEWLTLTDKIKVLPVAAAHETFHLDEKGNYHELSYVICMEGVTIYHGGDMVVYPGLVEKLIEMEIDIAMLPINGRDWMRDKQGIIGNTDSREAADLGVAIGADLIIPMHFDLYPVNQENPATFVDYMWRIYPGWKYHIFQPGEKMIYHNAKEKV